MALFSAEDEKVLTQHLSAISKPVSLVLFTQAIGGSESGHVARQILDELARLNESITVVEKNFVLDQEDKARYGVERSPAIVVLSDSQDTRIRFFGAPTGYEFMPLVEAVILAGTGSIELLDETQALLAGVNSPLHLQVFSTPT